MLDAITALIFQGDFTSFWSSIGIEEDSPLINLILTVFGW